MLIVDDLLATGGTAKAVGKLVNKLKGKIFGYCFLIYLKELNGLDILLPESVFYLIDY